MKLSFYRGFFVKVKLPKSRMGKHLFFLGIFIAALKSCEVLFTGKNLYSADAAQSHFLSS